MYLVLLLWHLGWTGASRVPRLPLKTVRIFARIKIEADLLQDTELGIQQQESVR